MLNRHIGQLELEGAESDPLVAEIVKKECREAGLSEKARLLTRVMALNRLVSPRSEYAMPRFQAGAAKRVA